MSQHESGHAGQEEQGDREGAVDGVGEHLAHFWEMLAFLQGKPCLRIEAKQRIGRLVREGRTFDALFIALWADWQDARDAAEAREVSAMPRQPPERPRERAGVVPAPRKWRHVE